MKIIATLVANSLVNRGLGEFVGELGERTGRTPAAIARAYIIARDAFGLVPLLGQLELLTGRIGAARQSAILGVARARSGIYASATDGVEQLLLPLSLSYDHRVIDGADAVRFLVLLVEMLNDPLAMLVDA